MKMLRDLVSLVVTAIVAFFAVITIYAIAIVLYILPWAVLIAVALWLYKVMM